MKPVLQPIFQAHLKHFHKGIIPSNELVRAEEAAFFAGAWTAIQYVVKSGNLSDTQVTELMMKMREECMAALTGSPVNDAIKKT